jgi:hypothetical protein
MLKVKTIDYHIPEVKPQEKDNESLFTHRSPILK